MSLQLHTTFSENDSATFRDYSTKGNDGTTIGGPALENGDIGKRVAWAGTEASNHGDITALEGVLEFSFFWVGQIASSASIEYIAHKEGVWTFYKDASDKLVFDFTNTSKKITLTSSAQTAGTTLYVGGASNGTLSRLWISGTTEDTDSTGAGNLLTTTGNDVVQGARFNGGYSNHFTGKTEEFRAYSSALGGSNFTAIQNNEKGFYVVMSSIFDPDFQDGDLIYNSETPLGDVKAVVTLAAGSGIYKLNPVDASAPVTDGMMLKRAGHCWDTARQQVGRVGEASLFPYFETLHGVSNFTKLTDGTQVVTTIGEKGIGKREVTKTANYTLTDNDVKCFADATSGAITITLPAFPYLRKEYEIVKFDSTSNAVTIDGNGSNINGSATQDLDIQFDSIRISYHDSAGAWYVV